MGKITRVAVVTGANRGIGFELVKRLTADRDITVILAARTHAKASAAAKKLKMPNVVAEELDVSSQASITHFIKRLGSTYGRCDILINNAGVSLDRQQSNFNDATVYNIDPKIIHQTIVTNAFGPMYLMRAIVPMMQKQKFGRVVNVSSILGSLQHMDENVPAYRLSKLMLNGMTRMFAAENTQSNVKINSVHPGWVRTDMGGKSAPRSIADGAKSVLWAAQLPDDGPSGGFFYDGKKMEW